MTTADPPPRRRSDRPPAPPPPSPRTITRLLAVVAVILVVGALKLSAPVTLPLTVAVFLIMLAQPLQEGLERRVPRWLAVVVTTLVVLLGGAVVVSGFALSVARLTERGPELMERLDTLSGRATTWARAHGLPAPAAARNPDQAAEQVAERALPLVGRLVASAATTLERLGLIAAFFLLGLLEVRDFQRKVEGRLRRRHGDTVVQNVAEIAQRVRRYLVALSLPSVVCGVATGLFCWAMGLDAPYTWGLVAFLLNYVPTIGPFVAVVPPSLYALLQFPAAGRAALVFAGVGAIQFVIGNFIDPKIEGRALALSPVVVLVAIIFWGWVWGVFGALLAVPITVALVVIARGFPGTQWFASLLVEAGEEEEAASD
jgi:predicted PurR-regulated permease PerM